MITNEVLESIAVGMVILMLLPVPIMLILYFINALIGRRI